MVVFAADHGRLVVRDLIRAHRADPGHDQVPGDIPTPQPDAPRSRRLLTITEVAELLGVDVRHVRRLVYEKRIPFKWGHLLRFDPIESEAWIDSHRHRTDLAS